MNTSNAISSEPQDGRKSELSRQEGKECRAERAARECGPRPGQPGRADTKET